MHILDIYELLLFSQNNNSNVLWGLKYMYNKIYNNRAQKEGGR